MARPRKDIDWETVEKLCGLQCLETEIADFIGVSIATLYRAAKRDHGVGFDEYFAQKRGMGRVALRRAQWQAAQKGNPALLIWLGKQHLDQKDKSALEHTGKDGGPIAVSNLTDQELDAKIALLLAKGQKASQ